MRLKIFPQVKPISRAATINAPMIVGNGILRLPGIRCEDAKQVTQAPAPIMKVSSHIKHFSTLLLGGFALLALASMAMADQVSREQDIIDLRLGQRIQVDDGSCPAGEIKEVSGTKMTATGILRAQKCIPRLGPKKR